MSTKDTRSSMAGRGSLPVALLIVDDDPDILDFLQILLEDEGYTVLTAPHGAAALALLRHTPVALILTDFMMPQLSGLALAQQVRANPHTATIPLILMSAALPSSAGDLFARVIQKPYSIDDLLAAVRQALSD